SDTIHDDRIPDDVTRSPDPGPGIHEASPPDDRSEELKNLKNPKTSQHSMNINRLRLTASLTKNIKQEDAPSEPAKPPLPPPLPPPTKSTSLTARTNTANKFKVSPTHVFHTH
ncbi:hypothetical protein MJO29_000189, partial [Puccinia striiformis f. sp. tritici]